MEKNIAENAILLNMEPLKNRIVQSVKAMQKNMNRAAKSGTIGKRETMNSSIPEIMFGILLSNLLGRKTGIAVVTFSDIMNETIRCSIMLIARHYHRLRQGARVEQFFLRC